VIVAIALGVVGPKGFARAERPHAGVQPRRQCVRLDGGRAGRVIDQPAGFLIASTAGIFVVIATLMIKPKLINHELARGLQPKDGTKLPSGFTILLRNPPLLMLAVVAMLFHLANAAMLPITGQKLAIGNTGRGALFQAALIVVAQLVMVPMAMLVAKRTDRWGRKPLFVAAFIVLPIRGHPAHRSDVHAGRWEPFRRRRPVHCRARRAVERFAVRVTHRRSARTRRHGLLDH